MQVVICGCRRTVGSRSRCRRTVGCRCGCRCTVRCRCRCTVNIPSCLLAALLYLDVHGCLLAARHSHARTCTAMYQSTGAPWPLLPPASALYLHFRRSSTTRRHHHHRSIVHLRRHLRALRLCQLLLPLTSALHLHFGRNSETRLLARALHLHFGCRSITRQWRAYIKALGLYPRIILHRSYIFVSVSLQTL